LPAAAERALRDGDQIEAGGILPSGLVRLYAPQGRFIGVGEISGGGWLGARKLFLA
jgi:hypothetical protein